MMPYQGAVIAWDTDGGMVCLTDLWRAAGSPENKDPYKWLRTDTAQEYIEACARLGTVRIAKPNAYSRRGGADGGGTWHEKIVGLAYAQNLNADLYVACNQFILISYFVHRAASSVRASQSSIADSSSVSLRRLRRQASAHSAR